jgi:hypothetical protein
LLLSWRELHTNFTTRICFPINIPADICRKFCYEGDRKQGVNIGVLVADPTPPGAGLTRKLREINISKKMSDEIKFSSFTFTSITALTVPLILPSVLLFLKESF